MKKTLPLMAGLAGTLFVSGMAQGGFVGIALQVKESADKRLLICNLLIVFDTAGEAVQSINGLPAGVGPGLFFSTNSSNGFHQEQFFGSDKDFAITIGELGAVPAMANDTYYNVGIKTGQTTNGGVASGTPDDYSGLTGGAGITFGWNLGGKLLNSDSVNGGAFVLVDLADPITDQNISGANSARFGNSVFIAQLVIDINRPTNDGNPARIDVQIANIIWQDTAGVNHLEGFDPDTQLGQALTASHIVPAPGTLALLGLAGLAGIRRRRR